MSIASKPQAPSTVKQNPTIPRVLFDSSISSPSRIKYSSSRSSIPLKPSTTLRRTTKTMVSNISQPSAAVSVIPQIQRKFIDSSPTYNQSSLNLDSSDISFSSISSRIEQKPGFISRIPVRKTSVLTNLTSKQEKVPRKNVLQPKTNVGSSLPQMVDSKAFLVSQNKFTNVSRIPVLSSKYNDSKLSSKLSLVPKQNLNSINSAGRQGNVKGLRDFNSDSSKNFILPDPKPDSTQIVFKKSDYQEAKFTPRKKNISFNSNDNSNSPKRLNLGLSRPALLSNSKLNVSLNSTLRLKTFSDTKQKMSIPTALSRPEKTNSILEPLSHMKASSLLRSAPELNNYSQSLSKNTNPKSNVLNINTESSFTNNISKSSTDEIYFETYSSHTIEALKKIHQIMLTRGTPASKARASKLAAIIAAKSAHSSADSKFQNSPDSMDSDSISNTFRYSPRTVPKELSKIPLPPTFYRTPSAKRLPSTVFQKNVSSIATIRTSSSDPAVEKLSTPFSPYVALKFFGSKLSAYEKSEIINFTEVYYLGRDSKETDQDDKTPQSFSSSEGDLHFKIKDHLVYRYEIQKILGKGSFGQVVQAYDHKHKREIAIKIIKSSEKFQRQALTEIGILEALARYDKERIYNVLHITGSFRFRKHLCLVTELYGINLYEHIKVNQFAGFRPSIVHSYAIQILKCLCLLKANNIIHCDLKPENILLTGANSSQIKVIDFGSSCYSDQRIYTYIQSRFYRSPEVVLELPYGTGIDMWSFGCIIVELLTGHPIFPGESEPELMSRIVEVLGLPDPIYISKSRRRVSYFDISGNLRTSHRYKKRVPGSKPLSLILKNMDELLIDFISKCLQFSPEKRMTPQEAINHPWISGSRSSTSSSIETESPLFALNHTNSDNATYDYIHRHPELFPQPILSYDYTNKSVNIKQDPNSMYRY